MADSDKPSPDLLAGRRALDALAEVRIIEDLALNAGGLWTMRLALSPDGLGASVAIPTTTEWYVRIQPQYPFGIIDFLPARRNGLPGIFPHQMRSRPEIVGSEPWRHAKICVATDTENNLRRTDEGEPSGVDERLAWQARRALDWLRAASKDELLAKGDPFELPVFPGARVAGVPDLAFIEGPEEFVAWQAATAESGLADGVVEIGRANRAGTLLALRFATLDRQTIVEPRWTAAIEGGTGVFVPWIMLKQLPVIAPYAAPATWGELRQVVTELGMDLDAVLEPLIDAVRAQRSPMLLLGFPVPAVVGEPNERIQWQALGFGEPAKGPKKASQLTPSMRKGLWNRDRASLFADDQDIAWLRTENWHPDQIGTRGRLAPELCKQKVLIAGAGALGSAVAELLVRAGVTDVTIVDPDSFAAGNLARHTLVLADVGEPKAVKLAERLNQANPGAQVAGVTGSFMFTASSESPEAEQADLIIDTTGDRYLVKFLGRRTWHTAKAFVSMSFSYGAKRLYFYRCEGDRFDAETFETAVAPWVQMDIDAQHEPPMEGIGCWHPVFPARADEVWLLASVAVATLEAEHARRPWAQPELSVFERAEDDGGLPKVNRVGLPNGR